MWKAFIHTEWAQGITRKLVWEYNQYSAETLASDVDLHRLGGLAVELVTPRIATSDLIANARSVKRIIDLSFGGHAVETHTGLLMAASEELLGPDDLLTRQLQARAKANSEHGPNEPWFIAQAGVTILEVSTADVTD